MDGKRENLVAELVFAVHGGWHVGMDGAVGNLLVVVIRREWEPELDHTGILGDITDFRRVAETHPARPAGRNLGMCFLQ